MVKQMFRVCGAGLIGGRGIKCGVHPPEMNSIKNIFKYKFPGWGYNILRPIYTN
jgi:hypothetical protein